MVFLAFGVYVSSTTPQVLSENEQIVILQYAEPIVDNLLIGINEKDYAKFSKDFAPGLTINFDQVTGAWGEYISKGEPSVFRVGDAAKLVYNVRFEKVDRGVLEIIISDINGKKLITELSLSES